MLLPQGGNRFGALRETDKPIEEVVVPGATVLTLPVVVLYVFFCIGEPYSVDAVVSKVIPKAEGSSVSIEGILVVASSEAAEGSSESFSHIGPASKRPGELR